VCLFILHRLYKIQLDHAQKEIYRAQETITIVDRDQQRHAAEKEAAKNRSKARQLNETLLVQAAREEAWRLGLQEGLNQGRNIAIAAEPIEVLYNTANPPLDDASYSEESRSSVAQTQSQFHIRTQSPVSPTHGAHKAAGQDRLLLSFFLPEKTLWVLTQPNSPQPSAGRPLSAHASDVPDQIRPISVHNVGLPRSNLPIPDNLIPSRLRQQIAYTCSFRVLEDTESAPSVQLPKLSDASQEALPIPPPVQPSASQPHRRPTHRRNSSSGSSTLSTLDIINEPFGGNLRTPTSAIPEVLKHDNAASTLPCEFWFSQARFFSYVLIELPSTTLSINHHRENTVLLVVTAYRKVNALRLEQSFITSHVKNYRTDVQPPVKISPRNGNYSFLTDSYFSISISSPVHCRIGHPKRVEVPHPDIVSLFLLHPPGLQGFQDLHP